MRLIQRQSILAAVLALIAASCQTANAQYAERGASSKRATSAASDVKFITKVYRVDDLILPSPNYPFRGTWLPEMTDGRNETSGGGGSFHKRAKSGGVMGGMGGMMPGGGMYGGMGGAGGGGEESMMPMGGMMGGAGPGGSAGGEKKVLRGGNSFTLTADDLIEAVATFIEPGSWDAQGAGDRGAEIGRLGNSLVVRHSTEVHKQIEEFLQALREDNTAMQTLTIEAHWLLLDNDQLAKLKAVIANGGPIEDAASNEPYRGQVTCFNGQTVHIVSGRLQTVLQGGIPVVSGGGAVGYQPTMITPHVGAMLEITPTLLPGGKAAIVNIQSSVTRWDRPGAAAQFGGAGAISESNQDQPESKEKSRAPVGTGGAEGGVGAGESAGMMMSMMGGMSGHVSQPVQVDRINVVAQQLATSLRVPLAKPVLVGGMTFPGSEGTQTADSQLYLVIKISVAE